MFYIRFVLILLWLILSSSVGVVYAVLRWGNINLDRDFARIFSWGALKILGFKVEVEGREHLESLQPCIYVANHQSGLDMATFGPVYPRGTILIGKKEVKWIPFFGLFYMAAGNISIDRRKTAKAVAGLNEAVEAIKTRRVSIWLFPEGTRNRTGEGILPLKKGAFHMARQAGIPVVALVSSPLAPLMSWKDRRLKRGTIKIRVLPPMSTQGMTESQVDAFAIEVRSKMLEALHGLAT